MKKEEHDALINRLLSNHTDTATVTESLQKLREDYSTELSVREELEKKKTDLESEVQRLKENNMALFLKIGNPVQAKTEEPEPDPEEALDEIAKGWDL